MTLKTLFKPFTPVVYHFPDEGDGLGDGGDDGDLNIIEDGADENEEEPDGGEEGEEDDNSEVDDLSDDEDADEGDDEGDEDEEEEDPNETPEEKAARLKAAKEAVDDDKKLTPKALKEKYPDIFKQFPELKKELFRNQEFNSLFGSVKDAQTAAARSEDLAVLEANLIEDGDAGFLLKVLKERAPDAFKKFSKRFVGDLFELDRDTYREVTNPLFQFALSAAVKEGKSKGDKNMVAAAKLINHFMFGSYDVKEPEPDTDSVVEERVKSEREKWMEDATREATSEIYDATRESILVDIMAGLPKDMSKWQKEKLADDIADAVDEQLRKDAQFVGNLKTLFGKARASRYSRESKARIKSAYLARAKNALPRVIARKTAEATGSKTSPKSKVKKQFRGTGGRSGDRSRIPSAKEVDWDKTSDLDFINGNVSTRK